ncbi:MAG TPA: ATP-binding protein [Anaerolineales bacterium]
MVEFNQTAPLERTGLLERYRRLSEISRDLASTLDLDTLLNHIVNAAADMCNAEAASILLYDPAKQELYFDAATNLEEPLMRGLVVPVENSIAGWIVTTRQPIIISDTQNDPRHFGGVGEVTQVTTTSMLGVPLIAKEKVIGALEAINKLSGEFDLEDQDLLTALGAQAAVAIENARLFQQSDLISELVHELRTPLTSLNTAARLLLRPQTPSEMRENMIEVILGETSRLSEMTTAFLDLARLESGRAQFQVQIFDISTLLEECVCQMQSRAQEKGIKIHLETTGKLPNIRADQNKIKQVLLNLLSNAIKYNRTGGSIIVRAEIDQDEMVLQVSDTGPGIPPENLTHIFTKFYRVPGSERLASGTGLGLSICKRIIDAHRGSIQVFSEMGLGTTFETRLPLRS